MAAPLRRAIHRLRDAGCELYPGYFALVMATGIISIAAYFLGLDLIARTLFRINVAAYVVLWLLTFVRIVHALPRLVADLMDHARGPGFFTSVAGTCVLGGQFVFLTAGHAVAVFLWVVGIVLWLLVTYGFFGAVMLSKRKPALEEGINGAWLIAIVATQGLSVLSAHIAFHLGPWREAVLFFALSAFFAGGLLYVITITLIFYRFAFFALGPESLTPPYWINMGAVAITTLAGATLLTHAPEWALLAELALFLKGFTLFFWASATWWIPLLLLFGVWRHAYVRIPFRYDPQYWGMVFPLGMYSACTFQLARVTGLTFLEPIARHAFYVAITAWALVSLGLACSLLRHAIALHQPAPPRDGSVVRS